MRIKIFLLSVLFLFTVKLASAQIGLAAPALANFGDPFTFTFTGEDTGHYVVSVNTYAPPSPTISSLNMGSLDNSTYGASPSTISGTPNMVYGYTSGATYVELEVGIYELAADRITYQTFITGVEIRN